MPIKPTKIKIIILLLINLIVWGGYLYTYIQIKNGEIKMSKLEAEMMANLKSQEISMILSKNLDDIVDDKQKIMEYLVSKEGEVDFIKSLEDLVVNNNLKSEIKLVKIEPNASSSLLEYLIIELDVTGEWSNVVFFEQALEEIPLPLFLKSFSLSRFDTYNVKGKQISQWLGNFSFKVAKIKE